MDEQNILTIKNFRMFSADLIGWDKLKKEKVIFLMVLFLKFPNMHSHIINISCGKAQGTREQWKLRDWWFILISITPFLNFFRCFYSVWKYTSFSGLLPKCFHWERWLWRTRINFAHLSPAELHGGLRVSKFMHSEEQEILLCVLCATRVIHLYFFCKSSFILLSRIMHSFNWENTVSICKQLPCNKLFTHRQNKNERIWILTIPPKQ